ncbi:hypothetical protein PMKS-000893 [Pichia membranifaciens]|uniref:RNA helicase n=1 Tax=Pichia membranifaciens TaxID=4926 RepID=A0A1Q2YD31_9ASCO|nr:hypothetical protein PMKS-000893 [Pichia membranifaciens]
MSESKGRFGKRVRNSGSWKDDSDLQNDLESVHPSMKRANNKVSKTTTDRNDERKSRISEITADEEQMLFGNKINLEDYENNRQEIFHQQPIDTSPHTLELPKREVDILRLEVTQFQERVDRNGLKSLSAEEKSEFESRKELLHTLQKNNKNESFLLPEDYLTEEGKIDLAKKAKALKMDMKAERKQRENEWYENQVNRAQQVNQLTKLKKETVNETEKQYEYVFDQSHMIDYVPDIPEDEMKELENKIELEELIVQEEKRISSIEETKKSLPVFQFRDELLRSVGKYQVLIVVGETGSGKTTQLPQYLYEAGYGKHGKMIGCTQPRRVAAVSVAARVADEVGTRVGDKVGYSIRFDEKSSENTVIKYMTDGMLVREFLTDHDLAKYSVMIIDEAHERTLQTDILLGLFKNLLKKRPDFKLIISSATINAKKFSDYFDSAPIFNVPGRRYPVEIFYTQQPEANYLSAAIITVFQIHMSQKSSGDILVFLTGQDEIETMAENLAETCKKLEGQIKEMVICPIYANLPPEQQKRIFEPTPKNARKVVISTNIAETSLTIDGIVYVIDCGFVKENVYNATTGMESLEVLPCSKASADQRAGRAGRVGPGKCFRLYTKWVYLNDLPRNPTPEILRTDLTGVVLLMMTLGITDLVHFDFMDKPSTKTLVKALELLYALGALNERGELTNVGIKMAMFPTKPMLSKSLLASSELKCCDEVLSIVSMLEDTGSLFVNSKEKKEMAKNAHASFHSKIGGDHLTLLQIWDKFAESGFSPQWCHDNFLQYKVLQKARSVKKQLQRICRRLGLLSDGPHESEREPNTTALRVMKAITAGYFSQSARLSPRGDTYTTLSRKQPVLIHPSSTLHGAVPPVKLIVYHELVMTTKEFMRHVMPVQGKWLAEYGRNYFDKKDLL